jgi:hypothetical protein
MQSGEIHTGGCQLLNVSGASSAASGIRRQEGLVLAPDPVVGDPRYRRFIYKQPIRTSASVINCYLNIPAR